MEKINSYVFLERDNGKLKKDKGGNYVLNLTNNVISVLKEIFNAKEDELLLGELENPTEGTEEKIEKIMLGIDTGTFNLIVKEIAKEIKFKLSSADSTEYLDIIIEDDNEEIIMDFMKEIDNVITNNDKLCENYIIIKSYDSISEYYCNKVYPKLNEFERKFRKLLYITYTAQFKEAYFETTTSKELQTKAKEKIKSKNEDYRIQNYLYSLDFYAFKQLLFEKSWNEYDENQLKKYLKKHNNLTELTDLEIRNKMLSIHPINDWERLFSNKGLEDDFENIITNIGKLRNIVAHNKILKEEEYNELLNLLESSILTIDKAIDITETEDFKRINNEKITETMEKFAETLKTVRNAFFEKINNLFENITLKNSLNFFGNAVTKEMPEDEEKDNIENEEEKKEE